MSVITELAEQIYTLSIQLKKYNNKKLLFRKNRLSLEKDIYQIQAQVDEIIRLLKGNPNYSVEYTNFAVFMSNQLRECIILLTRKELNKVIGYVWGFHNLPRALFSVNNPMHISTSVAMEYYKTYLKLD